MGGTGQYALRLSNALRDIGVDSTVLLAEGPWIDGTIPIDRIDTGVRTFAARAIRSFTRRISVTPFHTIRGAELYDTPEAILPGDVVHLQGLNDWIGFDGLRRMIPPGARVFQTVHGPWEFSGGCVILAGSQCDHFRHDCSHCPALRPAWRNLACLELNNKRAFVDYFRIRPIANSHWTAARINESSLYRHIRSVPIIPPIVHEAFTSNFTFDLREKLGIPAHKTVICVGARSLTDSFKGIPEFLIRLGAEANLANRVTVLAFGDGTLPYPTNVDVRLLGAIRNSADLADVFRTADLFISPSRLESFGMTLLEAQATGTPIVGFDVGGIRDAVWPDHSSNLVPIGQWDMLFQMISAMVSQGGRQDVMMTKMREWVVKSFSSVAVAKIQLETYTNG